MECFAADVAKNHLSATIRLGNHQEIDMSIFDPQTREGRRRARAFLILFLIVAAVGIVLGWAFGIRPPT